MTTPGTRMLAAACLAFAVGGWTAAVPASESGGDAQWSPKAAAAYLDGRAAWWMDWPNAARDHGTFCVSCHTALPYALARPALRAALAERAPSAPELRLAENVAKRVTLWNEVAPFYPDQTRGLPKSSESRGTEAILNALVLATRDAERGSMADETRAAFEHMWALQMRTEALSGAWPWLNFHNEPWESNDSPYFGAALAAVAVGIAPGNYAAGADLESRLKLLRDYFQREYDHQPIFTRAMVLWASARVPSLLKPEQRAAAVDALLHVQSNDGGWSTASLGTWKRLDGTALDTRSDGYATGLAILALSGAGGAPTAAAVGKGVTWLQHHQNGATGQWSASSQNKERDPASDIGKFMSDAATAFAVLALTAAR